MDRYRQGTVHECQPEISEWVLCADFEDAMPQNDPERHEWHDEVLTRFEKETGVHLLDLSASESDPDYNEVGRRLTANGYDIYNSDNYFEVYDHHVTCSECEQNN